MDRTGPSTHGYKTRIGHQSPNIKLALSDLYIADMNTGTSTILARAMGFNTIADAAGDQTTYLPFGSDDLHNNHSDYACITVFCKFIQLL